MDTKFFKEHGTLRIFIHYFKPHRKLFAVDMLCALLFAMVDLAFPVVSRWAINDLLPQNQFTVFFGVMGAMAAAYLLRALLYFVICYWGHTFGIRVEADIRKDLFSHMQTLGYDFYDRNRTGQLMSRLTSDLFEITELAHHGPEDLIISILTILGALIVMFIIQWRLALVVTVILPILLMITIWRRKKMRATSKAVKAKIAEINSEIESSLSGIRTAKAFANEPMELEKFDGSNERFKHSKREFHKEMGIFHGSLEFFMSVLYVAVIAVGGALIQDSSIDMVDLLTFSLYLSAFTGPVRKMINFAEMFTSGFAGLNRFTELMRMDASLQDAPDAVELEDARGEIVANHVTFAYEDDLDVLDDVSFTVKPGETIAIVGPSGGGKSTLCRLIPRFYDVTDGEILIDGHDVRKLTQQSVHQSIGVVQQDVFLFADTIGNNIRYGRPDATMEEIVEAAKRAEIYDDIMQMPDGFDTYVGERGTLLSGGQKQRVSIARIFLKNPPILILDEATSALDSVTEAKIQSALDALAVGRTTLIIAHRLSTIRAAQRIFVISDGKICEEGSHEELMQLGGIYASLRNTQNLDS